ncbi:hypothetical protein EJB05_48829, partial [Eragrostis curvula]
MQRTTGRAKASAAQNPRAAPISSAPCTAHMLIHHPQTVEQAALRRQARRGQDETTMASGGGCSLYAVLGVASDCSDADLRTAYRKLAMKWHPDKCAAGSSAGGGVEAAKARFQKIQGAYAVLSDPNKRILYDVGAYDSDGDDDGQGEILGDILEAMSKTENGKGESLEDMQRQFEELFLRPSPSYCSPVRSTATWARHRRRPNSPRLSFPFPRSRRDR